MLSLFPISLLLLAATVRGALLTVQSPRVVVTSPGSSSPLRSESYVATLKYLIPRSPSPLTRLSLERKLSSPITLNTSDTLKLTFQVLDKELDKGVQPHQTFLRFYDAESDEEGIQPVRVTLSGKAKFELASIPSLEKTKTKMLTRFVQNMSKPPASFPPTSTAPIQVSLIIGSPKYSPISVDLFDLSVPPSLPAPVHPDEASFHPLLEIQHAFRPDAKLPPRPISAFFALLVLAPWVVLLGMVSFPHSLELRPRN